MPKACWPWGRYFPSTEIMHLVQDERTVTDLAYLVAGVGRRARGGLGSGFVVGGARADNTNFIVDGFSDYDPHYRGLQQTPPNYDAVEEFRVQTTGSAAEYGQAWAMQGDEHRTAQRHQPAARERLRVEPGGRPGRTEFLRRAEILSSAKPVWRYAGRASPHPASVPWARRRHFFYSVGRACTKRQGRIDSRRSPAFWNGCCRYYRASNT